MLAPPLPPAAEATTAVSSFAPLSIVMVWPALKPVALATGTTVAPTSVAPPAVVAPAVPTVAMTAVSRFAPVSIVIVWPAVKSATLATLMLVAPAAERARHSGGRLQQEIGAEAVGVEAVGEAAEAPVERGRRGVPGPRRGRRWAPPRCSRPCLDRPRAWQSRDWRWSRYRSSCSAGIHRRWRRRSPRRSASSSAIEPALAERAPPNHCSRRGPLVALRGDAGVHHGAPYPWSLGQRPVERDAAAQRLHRVAAPCGNFVAGEKLIPVPTSDTSTPDAWSNASAARPG